MRWILAVLSMALLLAGSPAGAAERVKVGVLKLTSSAPIFIGVEKGLYKEHGVDPELVFFQAAAPIATALAAGQLEIGATGLTAALYNIVLGGEKLWIVADKGREWPGYPLTAIVVQKELWEAGLRTGRDLKGKRIGVTQLGSTFHYHIGNILEKEGLNLEEVVAITAKYTGAKPEIIRLGFPFQDRNGRLLVPDIERQMAWWVRHGFVKSTILLKDIVDTSFVEAAAKAVPE